MSWLRLYNDQRRLSFTSGVRELEVTVPLLNDALDEPAETFTLQLTNAVHATISTSTATGMIRASDPTPAIVVSDVTVLESSSAVVFTVTLTNASETEVTVAYTTVDGSAVAGSDYTATSGTLTFSAGSLSRTISVPLLNDTIEELDEAFSLNLANPTGATIADGQATATIHDNDSPTISVSDVSANEGNALVFTINLSNVSTQSITLLYSTVNGTATAGADYTAIGVSSVTFAPGETSKQITIATSQDALNEDGETVKLNLSLVANATHPILGNSLAIGTILDDDPLPSLSIAGASATESQGKVRFTVQLSAVSGKSVSVHYATTSDSGASPATVSVDYQGASGNLTIPAGQTTGTIDVMIIDDSRDEDDETFKLLLSSPSGTTIASGSTAVVGTILDDDPTPSVIVGDVNVPEGAGTASVTVHLSSASNKTITVSYVTANGTATAGADYTAASNLLTFEPGETTKTIPVSILNDATDEDDESFTVTLSSPTNATLGRATGNVIILDDDLCAAAEHQQPHYQRGERYDDVHRLVVAS
ncbi:MAG: Calx-beta domain-containing protein [Myxococcales bacterium]